MTDNPQNPPLLPESEGRTTSDLAKEAMEAMRMLQEKLRQEQATHPSSEDDPTEITHLELDVADFSNPVVVVASAEITLGRSDAVANYVPEVDLTPYGAYRLGISRRHAIIRRQLGGFYVIDLGSRNGTLLNGSRLESQIPTVLKEGDEISLGNLNMRLTFIKAD